MREQERLEAEARKRASDAEKDRETYLRSPADQARTAFERGDQVFQYSMDVMTQQAIIVAIAGSNTSKRTADPVEVLNSVCRQGRELVNGSFVFVDEGQQSRDKFMSCPLPDRNHFASWTGTAPIDASSGEQLRHRLSRAGNRRLNHVLYIAGIVQIRHDTPGRAYYRRRLAGPIGRPGGHSEGRVSMWSRARRLRGGLSPGWRCSSHGTFHAGPEMTMTCTIGAGHEV
jgi:Transposase IS116/IS110/IS902 family